MKYGEILFLGKCNCKCYYCLSSEMDNLQLEKQNQMNLHFKEWRNFDRYLEILKEENIEKMYLSSVITEPMLYKHIGELVDYIQSKGIRVGLRTNGYFVLQNMDVIKKLQNHISISLNSLNNETCYTICKNFPPNIKKIFEEFEKENLNCRISIVVNRFNEKEIKEMLDLIKNHTCVSYVQLRKVYKYNDENNEELDNIAYENVYNWLKNNAKLVGNYFESEIYDYDGLSVSLWLDVFNKSSIQSFNYFTNGDISSHNLLIPAYEDKEGCF